MVTPPKKNNLVYCNKNVSFQNKELGNTIQLKTFNLALQSNHQEIAKLKSQLEIAKREPYTQNSEKQKRAAELIIANKELAFQNDEKEKRAAELIIANTELAFQNDEKEKRAAELMLTNIELKCAEESQKEYIRGLEQIMYLTSHKVRQPIANILGLSVMLDLINDSKEDITQSIDHIKKSALLLDILTRELNAHVLYLKKKLKI